MLNQHQNALVSLLLGSFPTFQSGDAAAALAAYEVVLGNSDERDHQPAVMALIAGEYAGHTGHFAPTAPELAGAIREQRNKRLDREQRNTPALPPPPEPDIPDAERERVKAGFANLIASLSSKLRTEDAEIERRYRERLQRTNQVFDRQRERARGYSVGDPEAEAI